MTNSTESMDTLFSISRKGEELGEWTKKEVLALYQTGELVGTDYYWHEGLVEWIPLRALIKPPLPSSKSNLSFKSVPSPFIAIAKQNGLGRIGFALGFILLVIVASVIQTATSGSGLSIEDREETVCFCAFITFPILLILVALRLRNIGTSGFCCLVMLVPFVNLAALFYCLFKPGAQNHNT